ncbi:MAG TPA: ATP-binding protein [Terriglobales bacterium]|nr:ATP-binding protein [Terriglobales bacterium]
MAAEITFDERSWLGWLVKVRVLIITFLVGIELAITRLTPTQLPEREFISLILLWYTVSVFHIVLHSFWQEHRVQAVLQVLTDLALATGMVYVSGGIDSSFNFLYPLIIVVACILLPQLWAYLTAALAFVLYGAVVELEFFGVIHSYAPTHAGFKALVAILLINLFGYLAIAYLAGRLTARLRQVDVQLHDTSGALESLQALHENVIRSISGGLLTADLEGHITLANPASQTFLEKSETDLLGKQVAQLFLDPLPAPTGAPTHAEVRYRTATGEIKAFSVIASRLVVPERGSLGWVYTFDDLTEIRRLEREVRLRDRLAAVGRLAAAIAHEIRNPLSSIAGSVSVLEGISTLSEEQRTLVQIVTRESERLNNIISDFLAYAREKRYEFQQQDLIPLLEDTLTLLESSTPPESTRVQIVRRFEVERAPALVDGDKIKQVFWNLCSNSLRAMPQGGSLQVSLRGVGMDWVISFADSGHGLSQQQMEKIFEPFQGHFEGGTGLGLAIVYQIVQAHEAKIMVRSVPGQGTVFSLQLRRPDVVAEGARPEEHGHAAQPQLAAVTAVAAGAGGGPSGG